MKNEECYILITKTDLRQNGDPFLYFTNYNFSFFIFH